MNRKSTTEFLGKLLISQKFSGIGKYWAREVSIDYGSKDVKRIDFMQFVPEGQMSIDQIEKGYFICYEVKSCKADFSSGFGQNFIGEKNYLVMTMTLYKEIIHDIPTGIGVIVPIHETKDQYSEFEDPTPLDTPGNWKLHTILAAHVKPRKRSIVELLFCMLRSGH